MKNKTKVVTAAVLMLLCSKAVHAVAGPITVSGYGTLAGVWSSEDDADYRSHFEQTIGPGASKSIDIGTDSVLGLQADTRINDALSATVQAQTRRLSQKKFETGLEWAFVKYEPLPDVSVRAGRVVAPFFMMSDSRAVGYAQIAERLPSDMYLLVPITSVDGGTITKQSAAGDIIYKMGLTAGETHQTLNTQADVRRYDYRLASVTLEAEAGASRIRGSYSIASVDAHSGSITLLNNVLDTLVSQHVDNADITRNRIISDDNRASFFEVGYVYDDGEDYLQAEYAERQSYSEMIPTDTAWYLLAGHHIGNWMPFVQFSKLDGKTPSGYVPSMTSSNQGLQQLATAVDTLLTDSILTPDERSTLTLGARWDVKANYALKAEWDHIRKLAGSAGMFSTGSADFQHDARTINVVSVSLDFVF